MLLLSSPWLNALSLFFFASTILSRHVPIDQTSATPLLERDIDADVKQILSDFLPNPTCAANNTSPGSGGSGGQMIAVASYINPLADPSAWQRLMGYDKNKMPILIANVVNGPDSTVNPDWKKIIDQVPSTGKKILGYVRTGYLGISEQQFKTRLGSGDLADWTAQIEEDVDMWYSLYGNSMGGIFFDEGWPECGPNNVYANLYKYINDYTKRNHPGALTILNPGSPMASCFQYTMDTLLTFELNYTWYVNHYTANDWPADDKRKLWHIVYDVPESAVEEVIALSQQRGAGYIQVTNDVLDNPYDNLPADSYMQRALAAVAGGTPLNNDPSTPASGGTAGKIAQLSVTKTDYSSVHLTWTASDGATGYNVYSDHTGGFKVAASVPSSMTSITLGGLPSGKTINLYVAAIGGGNQEGGSSSTVSANTQSLPGGKTVTNYNVSSSLASTTTIKADILVPYAFVRLYIWDSVECEFDTNPGWSVNFKSDDYVCTHYMVEGTTLFKYSGTLPAGSTAPPWSWSKVQDIKVDVSGYTYTWHLPLGTSGGDYTKFVVQAQGYNPLTNAFNPDPTDYDCHGSSMCTTPDLLKWCDHAVNTLTRNDQLFYSDANTTLNGNCWGDQTRGCGVFIQNSGSHSGTCAISGNDMWYAYQNIRNIGGCKKCGSWHRQDGCNVKIDYVYECNNHS